MKIVVSFVLIAVSLLGCAGKSKTKAVEEYLVRDTGTAKYVKENTRLGLNENENFESVFVKEKSFALEETKESLVSMLWGIKITEDKIVINDLRSIKIFNKEGKFLRAIGGIGDGPGEFRSPECIDVINNLLFVYDVALLRISVFDLNNGNFIKSWNVNKWFQDMCIVNGKLAFLSISSAKRQEKAKIYIYSFEGNIEGELTLPEDENREIKPYLSGHPFKICKNNNDLIYVGADTYKVVCYNNAQNSVKWVNDNRQLKRPNYIPVNQEKEKWLYENYPYLCSVFSFLNKYVVLHTKKLFTLYDSEGKYVSSIKMPDGFFFRTDGEKIYEFTTTGTNVNDKSSNQGVVVYSPKISE